MIDFINSLNWQTIIGMFMISWYFTHEIQVSLQKQCDRTDRFYEMFIGLLKDRK